MGDEEKVKVAVLEERLANVQKAVDTHHAITNDKLDKVLDRLVAVSNASEKANSRIDEIEPMVEEHDALKNKGLGIVAFVGLLFGALGSGLAKLLGVMHQ